jgi:hypothetical protein
MNILYLYSLSYQGDEHVNVSVVDEPVRPCVWRRREAGVFLGLLGLYLLKGRGAAIVLWHRSRQPGAV